MKTYIHLVLKMTWWNFRQWTRFLIPFHKENSAVETNSFLSHQCKNSEEMWTRKCRECHLYWVKAKAIFFFDLCRCSMWTLNWILYESTRKRCHFCFSINITFVKKQFWRTLVLSVGPCFGLLMMSPLGFKALTCMLHCLCAMDSPDSPLALQLPTSSRLAWQPSCLIHIPGHVYRH